MMRAGNAYALAVASCVPSVYLMPPYHLSCRLLSLCQLFSPFASSSKFNAQDY